MGRGGDTLNQMFVFEMVVLDGNGGGGRVL